jgi:hypothetical protein
VTGFFVSRTGPGTSSKDCRNRFGTPLTERSFTCSKSQAEPTHGAQLAAEGELEAAAVREPLSFTAEVVDAGPDAVTVLEAPPPTARPTPRTATSVTSPTPQRLHAPRRVAPHARRADRTRRTVLAEPASPVMVFETGLPARYGINRTEGWWLEERGAGATKRICPKGSSLRSVRRVNDGYRR